MMKKRKLIIESAAEILGTERVISAEESFRALRLSKPKNVIIHYDEDNLVEAAAENAKGKHNWRLIWYNGLSLYRIKAKFGINTEKQPCFYEHATWWLKAKENFWTKKSPKAGYRLIDFYGRFGNLTWDAQEKEVTALGDNFERANVTIFTEACFVIFLLTGERIAKDWYHRGNIVDSINNYVSVGGHDCYGWNVNSIFPSDSRPHLRVVVAKKLKTI